MFHVECKRNLVGHDWIPLICKSTYFCSSRVKTFPGTIAMIYTIKCLCVDTYEHIFVRAQ